MTTLLEIYKGVEIRIEKDKSDPRPIVTVQQVPVMGMIQNGHKNIEDAKKFIDSIKT